MRRVAVDEEGCRHPPEGQREGIDREWLLGLGNGKLVLGLPLAVLNCVGSPPGPESARQRDHLVAAGTPVSPGLCNENHEEKLAGFLNSNCQPSSQVDFLISHLTLGPPLSASSQRLIWVLMVLERHPSEAPVYQETVIRSWTDLGVQK